MKLHQTILITDTEDFGPLLKEAPESIGQMIDKRIADQYESGQELHSIRVEFTAEDVEMFKTLIPVRDFERGTRDDLRDGHPGKGKKFKSKIDR